jgi:hypothetical protein
MVSFVRDVDVGHSDAKIRRCLSSTLESVLTARWMPGSDPFIFYELWRRRKSGYLISDKKLPRIQGNFYNLPRLFKAFCPNKRLFITELALRLGKHPTTYHETDISGSGLEMYLLRDAFELVLPTDLIGEWRWIKNNCQGVLGEIRSILQGIFLESRPEFKSCLLTLKDIFEGVHKEDIYPDHEEIEADHDLHDFLERIEEENLLEAMIGLEQDLDRLLDEELDLDYMSLSEADSYEDNIDFQADVIDESEESFEEVPLNEVRRLVRYYDELSRSYT